MIMKLLAILSLILVFWCHQSHHHIFMLINTGPLGLASEEFIPVASEVISNSEDIPSANLDNTVAGSQSDYKSDSVDFDGGVSNFKDKSGGDNGERKVATEANVLKHEESDNSDTVDSTATKNEKQTGQTDHHSVSSFKSPSSNNAVVNDEKPNAVHQNTDSTISGANHGDNDKENLPSDIPRDSSNSVADLNKITANNSSEAEILNLDATINSSANSHTGEHKIEIDTKSGPVKVELPLSPNTPAPTPHKEDEPIPSFMEWTQIQQQKLQESNLANGVAGSGQTIGHNGHRSPQSGNLQQNKSALTGNKATVAKSRKESNAKNFASPDCGAKVIQSNPESQNANGVLSSSHDEYMLNKCGVPIWFIIELCEPLKIEKVSLGNLELFSSSPKAVEIGISDRYPIREWSKLGPFTLPDIRAIHSITFPSQNSSTFGKFLKVNILAHHGDEHFCPLSIVKVNGISEYEVLESENTHPEDIDATDKEESALYEEPVISDQNQPVVEGKAADKSVFGSAKDAVINMVRKVAQVVSNSDKEKDASQFPNGVSQSNCRSLPQCLPSYEIQFRETVLSLLSCNFSNLLPFLSKNSPWCGWDYCHAFFSKHSIGLPWQPEGFYASIFGGPSVLHALCNYHRPLTKESCHVQFITNASTASHQDVLGEGIVNDTVGSPPVKVGTLSDDIPEKAAAISRQTPQENVKSDNREINQNGENGQAGHAETDTAGQTSEPVVTIAETSEGLQQQANEDRSSSIHSAPVTGNNEEVPPSSSSTQQTNTQHNSNQQQHQPPAGSGQQQQQQKESVFVRLSNRIKTLERNQTLTASYLEELSRRFKKQNEENHHVNEGSKTFMNESRVKFKVLEDFYRFELRSLQRNTAEIRERLYNVQLQRSVLILICLLQFFGIVGVSYWVTKRFRQFETQMQRIFQDSNPDQGSVVPSTATTGPRVPTRNETPSHSNILAMRKRLTSDMSAASSLNSIEKSKKIKKKKKKLPDLKTGNVKVSAGPASAPIDYSQCGRDSEFRFEYPPPPSSSSVYDVEEISSSSHYFKENINPHQNTSTKDEALSTNGALSTASRKTPPPPSTPPNGGRVPASSLLSTQVDSPFQMITSTSTNFFAEPSVSTSSRFALLASPGPGGGGGTGSKVFGLKRSGSLTSLDSSSTSSYGGGGGVGVTAKTGLHNVVNGHGDSQSQGSNGSGKKRKNKGLKALMPKLFDR